MAVTNRRLCGRPFLEQIERVCALRPAFDKGPADSPVKTVCALRKNDDDTPAAEKPAAGGRQQSMRGAQN